MARHRLLSDDWSLDGRFNWALLHYWISRIGGVIAMLALGATFGLYYSGQPWIRMAQVTTLLFQLAIISKTLLRHILREREGLHNWLGGHPMPTIEELDAIPEDPQPR